MYGIASDNEGSSVGASSGVVYRRPDGTSVPKTGVGAPKHGKEDAKNEPHVGGNTWAGGTGGSDTAGLGGRGGPYRLDKGHHVHQVKDKDFFLGGGELRSCVIDRDEGGGGGATSYMRRN